VELTEKLKTNGMFTPIEVAVALSLYGYNVSPSERAQKLYDHFDGACMDVEDLERAMESARLVFAMTELPLPTAKVYVQHALERYGMEAKRRVKIEMEGYLEA
jgi:hypothetical protein